MVSTAVVDKRTFPDRVYAQDISLPDLEKLVRDQDFAAVCAIDGPFSIVTQSGDDTIILRNTPSIPLYVLLDGNTLYVANTLKTIKQEVPRFTYNNVRIVPSSHIAKVHNAQLEFERFREELPLSTLEGDLTTISLQLRAELAKAIDAMQYIDKNKRVAVLLSGGIDSSAVAALMRDHYTGLRAYSLDVGGKDLANAEQIANNLGIPLTKVPVDRREMANLLPNFIESAEEYRPFVIDTVPGFYFLARAAAKDGMQVLFTGSAANEMFGDYYPSGDYDVPMEENARQSQRRLLIQGRNPSDPLYNKVLGSGLDRYGFIKPLMDFGIETREPWGALNVLNFGVQIPYQLLVVDGRHTKADIARIAFPELGVYPEKERMADGCGISKSFVSNYRTNREVFERLFNVNQRRHNEYLRALE